MWTHIILVSTLLVISQQVPFQDEEIDYLLQQAPPSPLYYGGPSDDGPSDYRPAKRSRLVATQDTPWGTSSTNPAPIQPQPQPSTPTLALQVRTIRPLAPNTHKLIRRPEKKSDGYVVNRKCRECYDRNVLIWKMKGRAAQKAAHSSSDYCPLCPGSPTLCPKCFHEIHVLP